MADNLICAFLNSRFWRDYLPFLYHGYRGEERGDRETHRAGEGCLQLDPGCWKTKPGRKEIKKTDLPQPGNSFCRTLDLLGYFPSRVSSASHYTPAKQRHYALHLTDEETGKSPNICALKVTLWIHGPGHQMCLLFLEQERGIVWARFMALLSGASLFLPSALVWALTHLDFLSKWN